MVPPVATTASRSGNQFGRVIGIVYNDKWLVVRLLRRSRPASRRRFWTRWRERGPSVIICAVPGSSAPCRGRAGVAHLGSSKYGILELGFENFG